MARETAGGLRVFSPLDPVFTTKTGINYSPVRITKLRRNGIAIVHEGGTGFIHRNESSHWVFKLNPDNGEATLIPEASNEVPGGSIKFVIAK